MFKKLFRHVSHTAIALFLVAGMSRMSCAESMPGATSETDNYSVELSRGQESYTSPLVQISDNGALVRLNGISQLSGDISRLSASGARSISVSPGTMLLLSGSLMDSRSADAPDLDFRMVSFDPALSMQWQGGSLGFGPGIQWISVSRQLFRRRQSLHVDWTKADSDQGYSSYMLDYGVNRHADQFSDFNSTSALALYRRQFSKPLPLITEASIEIGASREHNTHATPSLANTLYYSRVTFDWGALSLDWSVSWMHQRSWFDAPAFPGLAARRDLFDGIDVSAIHALRKGTSLRVDVSHFRNQANSVLYESRYQGAMINLVQQF